MSAESDLLSFPQVDSFTLSDLSNFSEYEDFSRDILTMDDIDGVILLEDLDDKSDLKPLSMLELNDFSSSLGGIKEEDEEEAVHVPIMAPERVHASTEANELILEGKLEPAGNVTDGLRREETPAENILNEAGISLVSAEEMSCMPIEEDPIQAMSAGNSQFSLTQAFEQIMPIPSSHVPPLEHGNQIVPCTEASFSETCGIGTMQLSDNSPALATIGELTANGCSSNMMDSLIHVDTMPSVAPMFHINSPLSSPSSSVGTPDGCCVFKTFGRDESAHKHHMNNSVMQQAASVDLDMRSHQADPSLCVTIRHHTAPDVSGLSAMPRSRSSHALGQFRTPIQHLIPCPEELRGPSMQMQTMGYSNVSNFPHYQACSSPNLAESSPATPMRRVFSTGDIQARYGDSNLTRLEPANSEEHLGLKVGHYTVEERRVRLDRYRQKRNERNFSKKIKYACRKTLADSRPRIRGRFARTLDDSGEPLLRENGTSYDDDYEEVDVLRGPCSLPSNGSISFWNATGTNGRFHRGH